MALWRIASATGPRLARGPAETGPRELLDPELSIDSLLGASGPGLGDVACLPAHGGVATNVQWLAPVGSQPVWAAGVTYQRSHEARRAESTAPDHYDHVYAAERPELFVKALPGGTRGPGERVAIRSDSAWNVPEPELTLVLDATGMVVGLTVGNDMSSRSIEGENPLYLPQAKLYRGSCSVGPAIVPLAEAPDPAALRIEMTIRRDGAVVYGDAVGVDRLRRSTVELASWLRRAQEFPAGAFLMTGTALVPPDSFTLEPGDEVSINIGGIGLLTNVVELLEVGQ